jgi:hypothetical protein
MPVLTAHPQAMIEIMQILCQRLRTLSAIVEDGTLAMRGRVAKGLRVQVELAKPRVGQM